MSVGPTKAPPCLRVTRRDRIGDRLAELGLADRRPVLVVVGGARGMGEPDRRRVEDLIRERLVPALGRHRAAVVDGGTDDGVMRILGRVRASSGADFPLLGVAVETKVRVPGDGPGPDPEAADTADAADAADTADTAELEPGHSGVLLVPGTAWGDESWWISDVAGALAGPFPSVTLVVNGGEITYSDVRHSLLAKRPVLVLAGTGRTADEIAAALAEGTGADPEGPLADICGSSLVTVARLDDPEGVVAALDAALSRPASSGW